MSAPALILGCIPEMCSRYQPAVAAGSEGQGTAAANLLERDPAKRWRSAGLSSQSDTYVDVNFGGGAEVGGRVAVSQIALVSTNASAGAMWRVRGSSQVIAAAERLDPIASSTAGFAGGDHTDVDEGIDAVTDGTLTLGSGEATVELTFPAPAAAAAAGPGRQAVRIKLETPAASSVRPYVFSLELRQAGQTIRQLEPVEITAPNVESVVERYFDADELPDPAGAVSILVSKEPGSLGLPNSGYAAQTVSIHAVELRIDSTTTPVDTGWLPLVQVPEAWAYLEVGTMTGGSARQTGVVTLLDGEGDVALELRRFWRIEIRDPGNPDGYFSAGRVAMGPAVAPKGLEDSFEVTVVDPSTVRRARDRTRWIRRREPYLTARLPLDLTSQAGMRELLPIYRWIGQRSEFAVQLLSGDPDAGALSFWAALSDEEGRLSYEPRNRADSSQVWAWASDLEIEEVK